MRGSCAEFCHQVASPARGLCVNRPRLLLLGIALLYFVIQPTFRRACRNLKILGRVPGVEGPQNMQRAGDSSGFLVGSCYVCTCPGCLRFNLWAMKEQHGGAMGSKPQKG